ncbi:MAG: cyclic nucleotide-binding domain-containing protein [Proteobacteria bacterium]|nr:cyclic nucleotide-binding domain-containing protein [Pseudomonadota bacterium]
MNKEFELLAAFPIFSGLAEEELKRITELLRPLRIEPGEAVIREGEVGNQLYLLMEGQVAVSIRIALPAQLGGKATPEEKGLVKYSGDDHAIFGEHGLLGEEPANRTATITALTPCRLFEFSHNDLLRIVQENPLLAFKLIQNLCRVLAERLRQANQDIAKLTTVLSLVLEHRHSS